MTLESLSLDVILLDLVNRDFLITSPNVNVDWRKAMGQMTKHHPVVYMERDKVSSMWVAPCPKHMDYWKCKIEDANTATVSIFGFMSHAAVRLTLPLKVYMLQCPLCGNYYTGLCWGAYMNPRI